MSIFEIIGPVMVGPSSSHTAGACRLGYAAQLLLAEKPKVLSLGLHGSFLATGDGHGTKEALIAGILGYPPDDERLVNSLKIAEEQDLIYNFYPLDLGPQAHPNSVKIELEGEHYHLSMIGSSIGGGSIRIETIDDLPLSISGTLEALVLWHQDTAGFLARVTAVLACMQLNVATIRTSRVQKGDHAITIIEVDSPIPEEVLALLAKVPSIFRLVRMPILPGF